MFKYFYIIQFLITHDLTELKKYWEVEVIEKDFSWKRIISRFIKRKINYSHNHCFLFWWRLANEMYCHGSKKQISIAKLINDSLIFKYNADIMLGAIIGTGFRMAHTHNVIINNNVIIGKNCIVLQNVTIGRNHDPIDIKIGDNVEIGAGTVILGGKIIIGSNVHVGAMSFINKDIPDNCTVYTEKTNKIILKHN